MWWRLILNLCSAVLFFFRSIFMLTESIKVSSCFFLILSRSMAYAVWATKIGLRRLRKTAIVGTEVTSLWQAIPQAATTHRKCSIADSYKTRTCTCTHVYGKYKILGTDTLCHGLCLLTGLVPESPGEVSSQRAQPTVPASPVRRPLPW